MAACAALCSRVRGQAAMPRWRHRGRARMGQRRRTPARPVATHGQVLADAGARPAFAPIAHHTRAIGEAVRQPPARTRRSRRPARQRHASCAELAKLWSALPLPDRGFAQSPPTPIELFGITEDVLEAADVLARGFARSEGTRKGQMVNLAGPRPHADPARGQALHVQPAWHPVAKCGSRLDEANEEFSPPCNSSRPIRHRHRD
jgi:hypothetical protein